MDADLESVSAGSSSRNDIVAFIERRLQQQREAEQAQASPQQQDTPFGANHERRQEFRRMIDPGILRPNSSELALQSLQILKTLAENILAHPDEEKYRKFKPTNSKIKTLLVEPKGTLEYAVALGFRPDVVDFQPFYVFDTRRMTDLQIGLAIINETLSRQESKLERNQRVILEAKAAEAAAKEKLKQQFLDDRKTTALRGQLERETRAALAANPKPLPSPMSTRSRTSQTSRRPAGVVPSMGGTGQTLNGVVVVSPRPEGVPNDIPPPYEGLELADEDEDSEED
ncbi:uncharacterized protein FIBRA_03639 [Fibroporia radiculosa]|uniref:PUB domain-containing protein n=1 Tax=Fibroporia radiculosa TaxID=599839 RepID=J4H2I4_9APHY|nr:uncharacterized protein FIBRA_03639 [Fibroporia radiculosa]CCM01579.1 predicted protein [Fibroporia radiculosa]